MKNKKLNMIFSTLLLSCLGVYVGTKVAYVSASSTGSVNVTVPSNISVVFNEDGTNTIGNYVVENNSLVPITVNTVEVSPNNGWSIVQQGSEILKDTKNLALSLFDKWLSSGDNDLSVTIEEGSSKDVSPSIERGAWTSPIKESAFNLNFEYSIGQKDFTVSFDTNGGSSVSSMIAKNGEKIILPSTSRTGYTLTGWRDSNGIVHQVGDEFIMPIGGDKLTAQWRNNKYTIKFDGNGADAGTMDDLDCTYGVGDKLTKNAFTKTGYTFNYWNTKKEVDGKVYWLYIKTSDNSVAWFTENEVPSGYTKHTYGDGHVSSTPTNVDGDVITLVAQWTPNKYEIKFNENYINNDGLYKDSYKLDRWKFNSISNYSKEIVMDTSLHGGSYLEFTLGEYVGSFPGIYYSTVALTVGKTYTISVNVKSSKEGVMGLLGHEQGGRLSNVKLTTEWQKFTMTFVAFDSPNHCFIIYDTGSNFTKGDKIYINSLEIMEGSPSVTSSSKDYNSQLGTLSTPSREGYTFLGWYDKAVGGNKISSTTKVPLNGATYYAQWTPNTDTKYVVNHHQMNLDGSTYSLVETENKTGTTDNVLTLSDLKKTYEVFSYQNGEVDGSVTTVTNILADGTRVIDLYYSRNKYYLDVNGVLDGVSSSALKDTDGNVYATFDLYLNGKLSISNVSDYFSPIYYGTPFEIVLKVSNGKEHSGFVDGSYTHSSGGYLEGYSSLTGTITKGIAIKPVINTVNYNITYNLNGGTVLSNPSMYNVDTNTFTLSNPVNTGYTFSGWTGSNGTTPQTTVTIPKGTTGDLTYTANWEAYRHVLSYDVQGGSINEVIDNPNNYLVIPNGVYGIQSQYDTSKYIHVYYASLYNGSGICVHTVKPSTTNTQTLWAFERYKDTPYYYIQSVINGKLVELSGDYSLGKVNTSSNIQVWSQFSGDVELDFLWYLVPNSDGSVKIKNVATGTVIGIPNGVTTNNTKLNQQTEDSSIAYQNWNLLEIELKDYPDRTKQYGSTLLVNSSVPSKEGYKFLGWNTKQDGTGTMYQAGDSYNVDQDGGGTTLYAQWSPVTYSLSYDLGGGTVLGNPSKYTVDDETFTLNDPSKTGYTFTNWLETQTTSQWTKGFLNYLTGAVGTSSEYPNAYYSEKFQVVTGDYFVSTIVNTTENYRVRLYEADGTYYGNMVIDSDGTFNIPIDGYVQFLILDGIDDTISLNRYTDGNFPTGTWGDRVYTANWSINSYYLDVDGFIDDVHSTHTSDYVTFDVYINDQLVSNQVVDFYRQYTYGTKYEIKNITAKPGYKFNGIYTKDLSSIGRSPSEPLSGAIGAYYHKIYLDITTDNSSTNELVDEDSTINDSSVDESLSNNSSVGESLVNGNEEYIEDDLNEVIKDNESGEDESITIEEVITPSEELITPVEDEIINSEDVETEESFMEDSSQNISEPSLETNPIRESDLNLTESQ